MAGPGGGFSFANMFPRSGTPNNAAAGNDAAQQQNQQQSQGPGQPPQQFDSQGKPLPRSVPGTGMPFDPANPGADPNNVAGGNLPGTKVNPNDTGSPLDAFSDIFKMDDNNQQTDPLSQRLLELDPKKFGETVSKMDFTRSLNPELVQKALGGDTQAFNSVLNSAFQSSFAASTQMIVGIMEQAFAKNNGRFSSTLDGKFKNFQLNSTAPTNKALNHPAAKPVLQALRQQIANSTAGKNLSATEINQKAEEYFLAMGKAMDSLGDNKGGKGGAGGGDAGEDQIDWGSFLEGNSGNFQQ